jgi:hypothetical protein
MKRQTFNQVYDKISRNTTKISDLCINWATMQVAFEPVDFANSFPASAPIDHAHILGLDKYAVKIWDAVVTMLFNISPDTLWNFLDSSNNTFKLIQQLSPGGAIFIIFRKGNEVLVCRCSTMIYLPTLTLTLRQVAQYKQYDVENLLEFEEIVRCSVNFAGAWKINSASFGKRTRINFDDVWAHSFIPASADRFEEVATDEETKQDPAATLAGFITLRQYWTKYTERIVEIT